MIAAILLAAGALLPSTDCQPSPLSGSWRELVGSQPGLRAAAEREKAREAAVDGSRAGYLPRVDASASWQWASEVPHLSLELPMGGSTVSLERDLGDRDREELGLTASWTLFSGFSTTRSLAKDRASLRSARADTRQALSNYAERLGLLDLALRGAVVELRLARERLAVRERELEAWALREREGAALRSEVLQATAERFAAEADTAAARGSLDSLEGEFDALSGTAWPVSETDTLLDGICQEVVPDDAPGSWEERSLKEQATALRAAAGAAGATRWPWVVASAGLRAGDPGLDQFGTGWMGWGVAGLQAQWNLFDGLERSASTRRLEAEARALDMEAARRRDDLATRRRNLFDERGRVAPQRRSLEAALEAATEAEGARAGALRSGAALPDDLRDASLRVSELRARLARLRLREAAIALRLRTLSTLPLSFEEQP